MRLLGSARILLAKRPGRLVLAALALTVGLLVGPLMAGHASAYIGGCGSDPTVYLSNGKVVTLATDINTQALNVQLVSYTLHVPRNTYATNIVYDGGPVAETVQVVADGGWDQYSASTTVTTNIPNVQITVHMSVTGQNSSSRTGYAGQPVYTESGDD